MLDCLQQVRFPRFVFQINWPILSASLPFFRLQNLAKRCKTRTRQARIIASRGLFWIRCRRRTRWRTREDSPFYDRNLMHFKAYCWPADARWRFQSQSYSLKVSALSLSLLILHYPNSVRLFIFRRVPCCSRRCLRCLTILKTMRVCSRLLMIIKLGYELCEYVRTLRVVRTSKA